MIKIALTLIICAGSTCVLTACEQLPPPAAAATEPTLDLSSFPRENLTIEGPGGRHPFAIWLADSPTRRSQGLMFVRHLPKANGMLFLFGEPQPVSMWMKNTFISLDMLFIAADGRVMRIAQRTTPHSLQTIASPGDVSAVLEIAGGECERLGISVGDRVRHKAFAAAVSAG